MEKSMISALARFQRGGILNSVQTGGEGVCVRLAAAPCWAYWIQKVELLYFKRPDYESFNF